MEYYANPKKHNFRFWKFSKSYSDSAKGEDTNLYLCNQCGAMADSKTLYVMDREECNEPDKTTSGS